MPPKNAMQKNAILHLRLRLYKKGWKLSQRVGGMGSRNKFQPFRKVRSETEYMVVVVVEEAREDPW